MGKTPFFGGGRGGVCACISTFKSIDFFRDSIKNCRRLFALYARLWTDKDKKRLEKIPIDKSFLLSIFLWLRRYATRACKGRICAKNSVLDCFFVRLYALFSRDLLHAKIIRAEGVLSIYLPMRNTRKRQKRARGRLFRQRQSSDEKRRADLLSFPRPYLRFIFE